MKAFIIVAGSAIVVLLAVIALIVGGFFETPADPYDQYHECTEDLSANDPNWFSDYLDCEAILND
jgi:hypothetical protein